jgi:hypothetical protein
MPVSGPLNGTPLRFHQKSEHTMGQACRSLTVACPFSNASTAEMQKRFSRGDAVLELCTRLSLKEFGSVLNFLRTTFHSTVQNATGGPGSSIHIDICFLPVKFA